MKKQEKIEDEMRNNIEYITVHEMNEQLKFAKKFRIIEYKKTEDHKQAQDIAYISDGMKYFDLWIRRGTKKHHYRIAKDGSDLAEVIPGAEAFRVLNTFYKVPRINMLCDKEKGDYVAASPYLFKNPRFERQRVYAYAYDQNSAYAWAMLQPMPDTTFEPHAGKIIPGVEIGFAIRPKTEDPNSYRLVAKWDGIADYIFPQMPSPFQRFVEIWYNRKQHPKDEREKAKAKNVLVFSVGYMQTCNPFLRAAVLGYSERLMRSLVDENTIFANTDSIVSLVPRPDLKIGSALGEWKLEHEGRFAYVGYNYQWDFNTPAYRGIPAKWFPKGWDILRDPLPRCGNTYCFNKEKFKIVEVKENGSV